MTDVYKRYTRQAKMGIKGEAYFESLVSDYSLPHRIVSPKDVGLDYICEWVHEDKPTGVLWAAQVKTMSKASATPTFLEKEKEGFNGLDIYRIRGKGSMIDQRTLHYWRGLGIPVYLFVVVSSKERERETLDCFYKRFTPVLTQTHRQEGLPFYKVNRGQSFIAFRDAEEKTRGFARDLFVDYMRCNYYKGSIAWLNPVTIGLRQFPPVDQALFVDLIESYKKQICRTYTQIRPILERLCEG